MTTTPPPSLRLHHVALRVADPIRSAGFYTGVLGLPELERHTSGSVVRAVWLAAGDTILMLERELRGQGESTGSAHLFAFAVTDLAEWQSRLEQAGVSIDDRSPFSLYFRDPDGHRLAVTVYSRPPA